jgi:hypothetical protein
VGIGFIVTSAVWGLQQQGSLKYSYYKETEARLGEKRAENTH